MTNPPGLNPWQYQAFIARETAESEALMLEMGAQ